VLVPISILVPITDAEEDPDLMQKIAPARYQGAWVVEMFQHVDPDIETTVRLMGLARGIHSPECLVVSLFIDPMMVVAAIAMKSWQEDNSCYFWVGVGPADSQVGLLAVLGDPAGPARGWMMSVDASVEMRAVAMIIPRDDPHGPHLGLAVGWQ
jgi:hypothetical protein